MRAIGWIALGLYAAAWPALAKPALDNDYISVNDLYLVKGQSGPPAGHDLDTVVMYMQGGRIRTVAADGKVHVATRRFGDAVFVAKGSDAVDTVLGGGPAHEIVVSLKNKPDPPIANPSGLPLAYPRPTATRRLEGDRFVVWSNVWKLGAPTAMHFHDKDVLVIFRDDGTINSVTPDGKTAAIRGEAGEMHFNKAGRTHYEVLVKGRQAAMMLELKK